jgi:hypothetical protein
MVMDAGDERGHGHWTSCGERALGSADERLREPRESSELATAGGCATYSRHLGEAARMEKETG